MSNIMNLLIVFLMFMLVSLLWHQLFCISPEESLTFSGVFVMLTVFISGIFKHASIVFIIMAVLSVTAVICFIKNYSFTEKCRDSFIKRILLFLSPSMVMFGIVFIYCIVAFKGALFTYPDEIYQWGPAVRYMVETGGLPYGTTFTGQEITLSTATLFQYIWVGLNVFIERNCLIGNFLLTFIPLFLPFSKKGWESWKEIFLYTATIFLAVNVFTYVKYYNLLQDIVLPFWTGSIVAWLLLNKRKKINWWLLFGSIVCISAMKSMVGPLFAGVITLVLIIRQMVYYTPIERKRFSKIQIGMLSVGTVISIFGINFLWSLLIGKNVNSRFVAYHAQEKNIADIVRGIVNKSVTVINNGEKTMPNLSYMIMFFLTAIFIVAIGRQIVSLREQKIFKIVFSLYAIGFCLYLGIMLFAYIFVFSTGDSISVAGLERYLSYYMLMGSVPMASILYVQEDISKSRFNKNVQLGGIIILLFATSGDFISRTTTLNQEADSEYQARLKIIEQVEAMKELMEEEGEILALGTVKSADAKMLTYELGAMFDSDDACYQLYTRTPADTVTIRDVLTYPVLLKDYDYMWIYTGEDGSNYNRLKYYYEMPDLKEGAFYKIVQTAERTKLKYLGNIKES